MASIVERNNSVSVVYYYEDEDGTKKPSKKTRSMQLQWQH